VKPGNRRPSSFDFVFQTPKELSNEPKSLRSYLFSDASHTLGFVHKNVRPETILAFQDSKSAPASIFLTGFEKVRMSHGRSRLAGDSAWEKNL
jgi:hypothetical protein